MKYNNKEITLIVEKLQSHNMTKKEKRKAEDFLIEAVTPTIRYHSMKIISNTNKFSLMDFDDYISVGMMVVLRSIPLYDNNHNCNFLTYVSGNIKREMFKQRLYHECGKSANGYNFRKIYVTIRKDILKCGLGECDDSGYITSSSELISYIAKKYDMPTITVSNIIKSINNSKNISSAIHYNTTDDFKTGDIDNNGGVIPSLVTLDQDFESREFANFLYHLIEDFTNKIKSKKRQHIFINVMNRYIRGYDSIRDIAKDLGVSYQYVSKVFDIEKNNLEKYIRTVHPSLIPLIK